MSQSAWESEKYKLTPNPPADYSIVREIGRGTYGIVFLGAIKQNYKCVIKVYTLLDVELVKRECFFLKQAEHRNVVKLLDVVQTPYNALILEFCNSTPFDEVVKSLTPQLVSNYIFQLMNAIAYLHSKQIMHRDIKPTNILFNNNKRTIKLIDFGLADFYVVGLKYTTRVGSLYYKPPEILLGISEYTPAIDVWAAGCVLAQMIIRPKPLFTGSCEEDILIEIVKVLGTPVIVDFQRKEKVKIERRLAFKIAGRQKIDFEEITTKGFAKHKTSGLVSLLNELLEFNYKRRISADQIIKNHTMYFF
ncbi:casein kinase II subunit alpha, putative [Entamoeba invadens IP1]|uniref:non-specific serine/threonine protein kinase n=1 Tax=Entamoeba invadens IP1 TaxID=370355 RepID=A0A0A1UDZ0_ENTIV|nr:casein kinase II subunit alpha, putative [Entamoeba invadens IP1]ELP91010.1 casein kinase II subunit alpha, putative [Entamoeba invadens IP1]|eukprot:XP_004257781.1 casein kinase II subunit alpha, putative [Entamoeba invadens IP1]